MSDAQIPETKKRGRPKKAETLPEGYQNATETLSAGPPKIGAVIPRTEEGTWSADDVRAKRLGGQPFGLKVSAIPMREREKWQLYIANTSVDDARHFKMVAELGWEPVTAADLAPGVTPESLGFRVSEAGAICRGARGDEVVYKMPKADYDRLQQQKAAKNIEGIGSQSKSRMAVAEAASSQLGDEAAEFLSHHAVINVQDSQRSTV